MISDAITCICLFLLLFAGLIASPCEFEDSTNCHWQAETMGNGDGQSFADVFGFRLRF